MTRRMYASALIAAHLIYMGAVAAPARAMQILEAADHAELAAEVSARDVNRIALSDDRIARVVRAPDGFAVEHDSRSGDLYLRPVSPAPAGEAQSAPTAASPVTLFIGTERGFTYRLTLTPADRGSAQILIRNADTVPAVAGPAAGDPHVAALVRLVRAVAKREPLPGYAIEAGGGPVQVGLTFIETWRGPRLAALVFEAARSATGDADGAAGLAGTMSGIAGIGRVAAVWLAAPGTGPSGGRLAVTVTEPVAGQVHAGDAR